MEVLEIVDPRDPLEKATRDQLVSYAHDNGQIDIVEQMPAILIRKLLRQRGLTKIPVPDRKLGMGPDPYGAAAENPDIPVMNADDALIEQFKTIKDNPLPYVETDPDKMSMTELRKACKAKGIKMARTDNLHTLRDKLRVENAA